MKRMTKADLIWNAKWASERMYFYACYGLQELTEYYAGRHDSYLEALGRDHYRITVPLFWSSRCEEARP